MAHSGTVLGMLGGPEGVDPGICIVWFWFLLLRRYLAYRPDETARIGRLLDVVSGGPLGVGPFIFWFVVLRRLDSDGALTISSLHLKGVSGWSFS